MKKKLKINPKMKISKIISKYPKTAEVFLKYGFHCFGCMTAGFENLGAAAKVHGVKLTDLLKDLNRAVEKSCAKTKKKGDKIYVSRLLRQKGD